MELRHASVVILAGLVRGTARSNIGERIGARDRTGAGGLGYPHQASCVFNKSRRFSAVQRRHCSEALPLEPIRAPSFQGDLHLPSLILGEDQGLFEANLPEGEWSISPSASPAASNAISR